jgi:hypothetical protein
LKIAFRNAPARGLCRFADRVYVIIPACLGLSVYSVSYFKELTEDRKDSLLGWPQHSTGSLNLNSQQELLLRKKVFESLYAHSFRSVWIWVVLHLDAELDVSGL